MPPKKKKKTPAKKTEATVVAEVTGDAKIKSNIPGLMLLDVTRFRTQTKERTKYFFRTQELDFLMKLDNNPEVRLRFSLSLSFSLYHSLPLYMDPPRCHFRANVSLSSCSCIV
jgi:hypothetical protein